MVNEKRKTVTNYILVASLRMELEMANKNKLNWNQHSQWDEIYTSFNDFESALQSENLYIYGWWVYSINLKAYVPSVYDE